MTVPLRIVVEGRGRKRREYWFLDHARLEAAGFAMRVEGELVRDTEPLVPGKIVEIIAVRHLYDQSQLGRYRVVGQAIGPNLTVERIDDSATKSLQEVCDGAGTR